MYHAYGQAHFAILSPIRQVPTYILHKFEFLLFLDCIQRFRITNITGVPSVIAALAKHPDVVKYDLSSVVAMGSGAAPLSKDIARLAEERVGRGREKIHLRQGWGMTEYVAFWSRYTILNDWVADDYERVKSDLLGSRFPSR